jgi:hypothetical protein
VGGDVYRLTDVRRSRISIYYVCAVEFGWTKEEVDKQPLSHLRDLIAIMKEERKKENAEMGRQSRKKMKSF